MTLNFSIVCSLVLQAFYFHTQNKSLFWVVVQHKAEQRKYGSQTVWGSNSNITTKMPSDNVPNCPAFVPKVKSEFFDQTAVWYEPAAQPIMW